MNHPVECSNCTAKITERQLNAPGLPKEKTIALETGKCWKCGHDLTIASDEERRQYLLSSNPTRRVGGKAGESGDEYQKTVSNIILILLIIAAVVPYGSALGGAVSIWSSNWLDWLILPLFAISALGSNKKLVSVPLAQGALIVGSLMLMWRVFKVTGLSSRGSMGVSLGFGSFILIGVMVTLFWMLFFRNEQVTEGAIISDSPQPSASSSNTSNDSDVDKIRKLAQLRDEGILTKEEFQSKKTDLLKKL